ncbi:MAG: transposase [bacterium]|nr:transposase [bacterium]
MRRARITFDGAYHHVMNKGLNDVMIFSDDEDKKFFLDILSKNIHQYHIRLIAYCIMNNHYHLVLQNTSGQLSRFMKQLNGQYGIYYRKKNGGKGYVFQNRYKSTLIQEDRYLQTAIIYVLLNPVRSGTVNNALNYCWSSIHEYFHYPVSKIIDYQYVESIFKTQKSFFTLLNEKKQEVLLEKSTKAGLVLGDEKFIMESMKKFNRRKKCVERERRREFEQGFQDPEQIIRDFEVQIEKNIRKINHKNRDERRLREQLLVALKEKAGLTYSEINRISLFRRLKYCSLGQMYKRAQLGKMSKCQAPSP